MLELTELADSLAGAFVSAGFVSVVVFASVVVFGASALDAEPSELPGTPGLEAVEEDRLSVL